MIMKNRFHKLFSFLGTALLGLLGFSSCGEVIIPDVNEYGTPTGKFKVDVSVTDEQGKPIKDIKVVPVVLHAPNYDIRRSVLDTISTDATGKAFYTYDFWWVSDDVHVIFEDIDQNMTDALTIENQKRKQSTKINKLQEEMEICAAAAKDLLCNF